RTALLIAAGLTVAACGPPWVVIKQSGPPSALSGAENIAVVFDEMDRPPEMGDSEEEGQKLSDMQDAIAAGFMQAIAGERKDVRQMPARGDDGGTYIVLRVQDLDPGKYAVVYSRASRLVVRLEWYRNNELVDEIEITTTENATITTPSILQRLKLCGARTGELAMAFLDQAQGEENR